MIPRQRELYEIAERQRRRCRDWLLKFIIPGKPKAFTKEELRQAAMRELDISKNSFDFAWIDAIESTGRHDWYDPLPRRQKASH